MKTSSSVALAAWPLVKSPKFKYMSSFELPNPGAPTNHPHFDSRHPRINVFDLMPVRRASWLLPHDNFEVNVASYTDPFWESDLKRSIVNKPRWMQGLLLRLNVAKPNFNLHEGYPANKVFHATLLNHAANLNMVGVMHPARAGWLAFADPEVFDGNHLANIVDLKQQIGQITQIEADVHRNIHQTTSHFELDGQAFS